MKGGPAEAVFGLQVGSDGQEVPDDGGRVVSATVAGICGGKGSIVESRPAVVVCVVEQDGCRLTRGDMSVNQLAYRHGGADVACGGANVKAGTPATVAA